MLTARVRGECERDCSALDQCIAFGFTQSQKRCVLFNQPGEYSSSRGTDSGAKRKIGREASRESVSLAVRMGIDALFSPIGPDTARPRSLLRALPRRERQQPTPPGHSRPTGRG
ncbi:PAN domain-containing protein [Mesorhizobium sp. M0933]